MKKHLLAIAAICAAITVSGCKSGNGAQGKADGDQSEQTEGIIEFTSDNDDEIAAEIRKMYEGGMYDDYEYIEAHCTPKLLQQLTDDYDYDHDPDDIVYAVWDFRGDTNDACSSILLRLWKEGDWYYYEGNDGGDEDSEYKFVNRVQAAVVDGVVMFSKLERVKNSWDYK